MVCFRSRRLAAGFFVCSVVLGACGGKKEESKGGATPDKGGASAASNKDLDFIPVESDMVVGVDLAQAQQSALFKDFALPMLMRSGDVQKVVETLKSKCNLDPMTAATRMTAGIKDADSRNPDGVAVLHGIEKGKAMSCLDQVKEDLAAQKIEVAKDGDVVAIKSDRGDLAFTFTGDTTAVVVAGPRANKERVLEVAQGKSTLKTSKEFNDMYSRVQTSHTAWALVNGQTPMVAQGLERLNVKSKAIFGSANVTDGLELVGRIRVATEEQAKNLAALMKSQTGMFESMAEKLAIEPEGSDVRFDVKLTQQQLKSVLTFARSFAGRGSR